MHTPENERGLLFAMCEFGGHQIMINDCNFAEVSEEHVLDAVKDVKLDSAAADKVKSDLIKLFSN
jgi:hypothetical protein